MRTNIDKLIFLGIKSIDLTLIGIYYFIGGVVLSKAIKSIMSGTGHGLKVTKKKSREDILHETPIWRIVFSITGFISLNMIFGWILRSIIRNIPFVFDRVVGYHHAKTQEIGGNLLIAFSILTLQTHFKNLVILLGYKFGIVPESQVVLYDDKWSKK